MTLCDVVLQMMYTAENEQSLRSTRGVADDSDSDDEPTTLQNDDLDTSTDDDDDDYDDCEQKTVKTRELEWDDSTLSY